VKKNIVLIGFMGAGKSVVAKELAKTLQRKIVSTDELIEKAQKKTIAQIFEEKGESYFRRLEREAVQHIALEEDLIVDCGGGIVLHPDNIKDLKQNGTLFYIVSTPKIIFERLKNYTDRPLLKGAGPKQKIEELLVLRQPLYRQAADYSVDGDHKTATEVAREILKLISV
jgi:shikimate kinase